MKKTPTVAEARGTIGAPKPVELTLDLYRAMVEALSHANTLATLVISGAPGQSRAALEVARSVSELERQHKVKLPR